MRPEAAPPSRRRFLATSLQLVTLAACAPWQRQLAEVAPQNEVSAAAALERLRAGNARYVAGKPAAKDLVAGRAALVGGQYPIATILSCSDSRVAPELVFDQAPGDLFVVRIAGNYLNPDALASLEYGVAVLGTPLVMVLGHENCGAIKAAIAELQEPKPLPGHIWDITDAVRPGIADLVAAGGERLLERAIDANIRWNVARVAAAQPLLAEAARAGRMRVVGARYDLASGRVNLLDEPSAPGGARNS